jgi:hypothetical protein
LTPVWKRVHSVGLEDDNTRERNEKIRKTSGGSPLETSTCGVENKKKLSEKKGESCIRRAGVG